MITILNKLIKTNGRPSNLGHKSKNSNSFGKRMLLLGGIASCLATVAKAQPEETSYLYDKYNMKHYATSQEMGGASYAMAGTIFDYNGIPGNNGIHLLMDPSRFSTSVVYDHKDFDERAINVHYTTPGAAVIVASLGDYTGAVGANGLQIIQHPSCKRDLIFAPSGQDYWPMGSIMDKDAKTLYVCGYVTRSQRPGTHPDYNTPKRAFILKYDMSSNSVVRVMTYDWTTTSPSGMDYDMAHRMKFIEKGKLIWVGGICNGKKGSAMMNMVVDLNLIPGIDKPINTYLTSEELVATSFDFSENLNGEKSSYVFGNYFAAKSTREGMYPQPSNYNITTVDAGTLEPVAGAASHMIFSAFKNVWGTNIVYGNDKNSVILSGYQDAEKCKSPIPSSPDNVNPFLTEMALSTSASGDISITAMQWATMLSKVGTGVTADPSAFYNLGNGLSNLVFGPVTTVRDVYGVTNDDIIFNGPVWNDKTTKNLNMKYIRANNLLDPKCETSKCKPGYEKTEAWISDKVAYREMRYGVKHTEVCYEDLKPDNVLNCAETGYYKGGSTTTVATVGNATEVVVATVYPNPAHDQIQVKLNGQFEAGSSVKVMLSDITGKQLSDLYNGTASGINAAVKLPNLPQGLYNVTVIYNGAKLKSVPLVIN